MTNLWRKHASVVTILAVILGFRSMAFAQTSVIVEVRVLELSRTDLEAMGGTIPKPGFAKQLTKSLAESLASGPRSRVVHRIELPATSGAATQVRLDSRISVTSSSSSDVQTYFDAGIVMDVTPKVFQNRDISLATASQVRIRRGPNADGTPLVMFENPATRFDTRIQEGESIVLGGFITPAERMTLPDMPMLPDNPILNYLYPKERELKDRIEVAILLTPRIMGMLMNPAVDAPVIVSKPAVGSPSVTSLTPPSAGPLAAVSSPAVLTPPPAITGALPGTNTPAISNSPPVVSSPPAAVSTSSAPGATVAAANRPSVVSSPPASTPSAPGATVAAANRPSVVSSPPASTPSAPGATVAAVNRPSVVSSPPVAAGIPAAANMPEIEGTGGKYTVQVGAFDQLDKAELLRSQLSKKYDMVFVEKLTSDKTPYRVRVGRFPDMQAARKVERQLISDGIDTYVTTLN